MANDDLRGVEVGAQRFSRLALGCVVILVGTGVAQAWHQVGELAALRATHYGQLLIVKVTVVAVILGFAAVSRSADAGAITDAGITTLSRSVAAEAALGVVVVALTAVLVATTPARVAYRPTVEAHPACWADHAAADGGAAWAPATLTCTCTFGPTV